MTDHQEVPSEGQESDATFRHASSMEAQDDSRSTGASTGGTARTSSDQSIETLVGEERRQSPTPPNSSIDGDRTIEMQPVPGNSVWSNDADALTLRDDRDPPSMSTLSRTKSAIKRVAGPVAAVVVVVGLSAAGVTGAVKLGRSKKGE